MASLQLSHITKLFKTTTVLDDVSLTAGDGETVVVFGPSGSGKTVLLRLVAGVHDPDAGAVLIDGKDITDEAPEQRGMGVAFQNFALFPHMSAYDNIASPLVARRASAAAVREGVEAVAKLLKIEHVLGHAPRELSNGQKQRTALARALVAKPRVLLLDDPLRNVDAKLRFEMRLELPRLLKQFKSTVLYVTQDYKEAMALGDRIAVLIDGRVVQLATPAEIYARPASVAVARLFGDPTINLIDAAPEAQDGRVSVTIDHVRIALDPRYRKAAGRACSLGIRPEAVAFCGPDDDNALPVTVSAVTPLNERVVTLLVTADGQEILASQPSYEATETGAANRHIRLDPTHLLLFDRATGERIEPLSAGAH